MRRREYIKFKERKIFYNKTMGCLLAINLVYKVGWRNCPLNGLKNIFTCIFFNTQ